MARTWKDRRDVVQVATMKAVNVAVLQRFQARAQVKRALRQMLRVEFSRGVN